MNDIIYILAPDGSNPLFSLIISNDKESSTSMSAQSYKKHVNRQRIKDSNLTPQLRVSNVDRPCDNNDRSFTIITAWTLAEIPLKIDEYAVGSDGRGILT